MQRSPYRLFFQSSLFHKRQQGTSLWSASSNLRTFSSAPPSVPVTKDVAEVEDSGTKTSERTFGQYTFDEDQIKGNRRGRDGLLLMAYTCGKCETKQARTFSKHSYEKGVVLIRCESCDSLHLIADNLGWFEDKSINIEEIVRRQGGNIRTNVTDQAVEMMPATDGQASDDVEAANVDQASQGAEAAQIQEPTKTITGENPSHCLVVTYSKRHEAQALDAVERVQKIWPGDFNYYLFAEDLDGSDGDKLEATVFAGQTHLAEEMQGVLVHSLEQMGTFVEEQPVSFLTYIERAIDGGQGSK